MCFNLPIDTAVQEDPIRTNAALKAFDEYYSMMHQYVDVTMVTAKCVGYGVIPDRSPISGASVFLPDMMKMEMVLPLIRKNIALNGVKVFFKLVKVFQSMGYYIDLAKHLEGKAYTHCIHTFYCIHTHIKYNRSSTIQIPLCQSNHKSVCIFWIHK